MQSTHRNDPAQQESIQNVEAKQEFDHFEIDLVELFYRLLEKAKYIVAAALVGAILSGAYTMLMVTPRYTATSKLYVMNSSESAINLSDLQIGTYLTSDYQEVFKTWHLHEMVLQELKLSYSYSELSRMLKVSNPQNTRVLYIQVTAIDPQEAKLLADTYAAKAQEFIASTMDTRMPNIFQEALLPAAPSSPNKTRNVVVGFALGILLACAVIIINFLSDDRIHSSEDIEKYLGMTVLGAMPKQEGKGTASRQSRQKEA